MSESRPDRESAEDKLIAQIGLIMRDDGGPRIAGLIFGLLLMHGKPLPLADMARRLGISRASASTNARLLAQQGLIRRTAQTGDRQDYYELAPDPYARMLDAIRERMQQASDKINEALESLSDDDVEARQRIRNLATFYSRSAKFLDAWTRDVRADE